MMNLQTALANYLAQKCPQGLVGGPPYYGNDKLRDKPDATGLASQYLQSMNINGDKVNYPTSMLIAVCDPSLEVGQPVYISGFDEARGGPMVAPAVPGTVKWPPVGNAKIKIADDVVVIPVSTEGELPFAGVVPGEVYVCGTDGKLAKKGDTNYPAAGTQLLAKAVAIAPGVLLLVTIPIA